MPAERPRAGHVGDPNAARGWSISPADVRILDITRVSTPDFRAVAVLRSATTVPSRRRATNRLATSFDPDAMVARLMGSHDFSRRPAASARAPPRFVTCSGWTGRVAPCHARHRRRVLAGDGAVVSGGAAWRRRSTVATIYVVSCSQYLHPATSRRAGARLTLTQGHPPDDQLRVTELVT